MERRSEKLTEALSYIKVPILFRIVEMYCPKNIWIYWEILIFILDEQYRTELGYFYSVMMYVRSSAVSPVWGYVRLPVSEKCMPMRCITRSEAAFRASQQATNVR